MEPGPVSTRRSTSAGAWPPTGSPRRSATARRRRRATARGGRRAPRAFEGLSAQDIDGHVSVKLSALGFDPELLAELDAAAARSGRPLHVDALAPETADATWRLLGAPRAGESASPFPAGGREARTHGTG